MVLQTLWQVQGTSIEDGVLACGKQYNGCMCTIFYCGTIIFATHDGVGGHQPLALQNTKYVPTHIEVARAGGCSHAQINSPRPTECAQRDFDSQAYEIRSHTHRDRARRRVQPRTHQLAASRRLCVARFRQPVAADSIVDPPAGLLMQLCSQEAPQYLALQKTKYVRSHIEVARASGRSHAHINSPSPAECAQRDFDSQRPGNCNQYCNTSTRVLLEYSSTPE